MEKEQLEEILNRRVFSEAKLGLLKSITENPDRFIGIFRSTTPQLKVVQNLLQSREIRFGDAMEEVMSRLFQEMDFIILPKFLGVSEEENMSCDHYFRNESSTLYYLIEQKMRDDHDSSKKRGQFGNFRNKVEHLLKSHGSQLVGIMYFIDPSLEKNKKYYRENIQNTVEKLGIKVHLFYNGELFEYFGKLHIWNQLIADLRSWRDRLGGELDFDFDKDPASSIRDLASVSLGMWARLISNENLWSGGVISTLFPQGYTLLLQRDIFQQTIIDANTKDTERRKLSQIVNTLNQRLNRYYSL